MKFNKREVVKLALDHKPVPYVPWHCSFTSEAAEILQKHYKCLDVDSIVDNHFVNLSNSSATYKNMGDGKFKDIFGVIWDRSKDKDIGVVVGNVLAEPTIDGYDFPDPCNKIFFENIEKKIFQREDCFRVYNIDFSLYERAWSLRGMENLMMDFIVNPDFVHELFKSIADYNVAQVKKALKYDIDAVYFGDDWGQQNGLQMGPALWKEFIKPQLARMYSSVKNAGKYVMIHSCGKADSLFDDLIEIGLDCFNPFQPEVMDVFDLFEKYKGKLSFHGGLSTQQTLPYGTTDQVEDETIKLLISGLNGGYVFAPAHAVEDDVSLNNMLAFMNLLHNQDGYNKAKRLYI